MVVVGGAVVVVVGAAVVVVGAGAVVVVVVVVGAGDTPSASAMRMARTPVVLRALGTGAPVDCNLPTSSLTVAFGSCWRISANAPATWGVAMEVPQ